LLVVCIARIYIEISRIRQFWT